VDEIRAAGGRALPLVADVSDSEQMRAAVEALVHEFGGLDIIFANAGINGVWALLECGLERLFLHQGRPAHFDSDAGG
jgi:NAD(P)-dependent dehydrogenase (short-subunit alcohol dehydrogenase family)